MSTSKAAKAEAEGKRTVTVEWRDLTPFEVPIYRDDWSFEAALAAEQGRRASLLVALLPADTLAEFRGLGLAQRDADDLLETVGKTIGFGSAGESLASTS